MAESDIFVRFGADIDPLKKGVNQASSKLDEFGSKAKTTAVNIAKISAAAAVAGIAIGTKLVAESLVAIDAQAKLAKQLGTTSTSIATLSRAADMSGISMKNIEAGAKNLEVAMGEAAQGTGVAVDTLERLGIAAVDLEGMSLDQKILTVNKAIKENIPITQQAAAAADLFGKRAGFAIAQLDPATISEATREVEGFGLAITDFDASKIEQANDAMATIGLAVKGVVQSFTVQLAPILGEIANLFKESAIQSEGLKEESAATINTILSGMGFVADAIEGVDRTIEVLGKSFALLGLGVADASISIAEAIVNKPVEAINELIRAINSVPVLELDIPEVSLTGFGETLKNELAIVREAQKIGIQDIQDGLLAPLPSQKIEEFIASIRAKNEQEALVHAEAATLAAEVALEDAKKQKDAAAIAKAEEAAAVAEVARQAAADEVSKAQDLANKKQAIEDSLASAKLSATAGMFSNLATLTATGSKKLFDIGKAAAAASTIVSTYAAAQDIYKSMAWAGPVVATAAAATAVVAGGVRLAAINAQSFGGGGGGVTAGAGSGGNVSTPVTTPQASGGAGGGGEPTRTMRVETLDPSALVSGSMVNEIAAKLVEFQEDGGKLIA